MNELGNKRPLASLYFCYPVLVKGYGFCKELHAGVPSDTQRPGGVMGALPPSMFRDSIHGEILVGDQVFAMNGPAILHWTFGQSVGSKDKEKLNELGDSKGEGASRASKPGSNTLVRKS